jgi:hypothetical protein
MDQTSCPRKMELCAHTDASWGDDLNRRRSTIGYVVFVCGVPVAWKSKLSPCVAGSTMEAEVIAANEGGRELIWLRNMTCEVMRCTLNASKLYMDNAAGMQVMSDRRITDRSKHIDIKYWWVMEQHELSTIQLTKEASQECAADIFTKPLGNPLFERQRELLGVGLAQDVYRACREGGVLEA